MNNNYLQVLKKYISAFVAAVLLLSCSACVTGEVFNISKTQLELFIEESVQLTTDSKNKVFWISIDEDIAVVDESGTVTGVSAGETTVIAVSKGVQVECAVTVIDDPTTAKDGFKLVWHDEFEGESLDMTKWDYQLGTQDVYGESTGPANWGNNELQSYKQDNVQVQDGSLVITAKKESEKVDGKWYTSGRITTRGKFTTTYGYVEARMKLPAVSGMWPAFWMLPQPSSEDHSDNVYGGWARNGEIDIMEARGRIPTEIDTTLHFGGNWPNATYKSNKAYPKTPITEWHTYALDWRKEYIAWLVDGVETYRLSYTQWWTAAVDSAENPYAPFDQPFYVLFNLAVGGSYDNTGANDIKANEAFVSASMSVDYVRAYALKN